MADLVNGFLFLINDTAPMIVGTIVQQCPVHHQLYDVQPIELSLTEEGSLSIGNQNKNEPCPYCREQHPLDLSLIIFRIEVTSEYKEFMINEFKQRFRKATQEMDHIKTRQQKIEEELTELRFIFDQLHVSDFNKDE